MSKVKIQDLTDAQANEFCARAQGFVFGIKGTNGNNVNAWYTRDKRVIAASQYTPATNGAQWGELMELFKISVRWIYCDKKWEASTDNNQPVATLIWGEALAPGRAIVNAVIASVYGDSIEIEGEG